MIKERLMWIDVLKFLAIFGIIVIHVSSPILSKEFLFSSTWYQSVFMNSLFRYSIVIFIMVSGYLILRKQQPLSVIPKRIKRILIPFIFWFIIYMVIKIVFKGPLGLNWNIVDLISYFINGILNPTIISIQFWYVYMILGLYILSPILSRWIQNAPIREIEYFLVIWAIISMLHFLEIHSIFFDYFRYFAGAIGYFVLGYYLSIKKTPIFNERINGVKFFIVGTLITFVGTLLLSYFLNDQSLFFIKLGDISPGACLQGIGLYIIIKNTNFDGFPDKILKFIQKISSSSYSIYLFNVLIINFMELFNLIDLNGFASIKIIFYSFIVLVISYLGIQIMKRIPILNMFTEN